MQCFRSCWWKKCFLGMPSFGRPRESLSRQQFDCVHKETDNTCEKHWKTTVARITNKLSSQFTYMADRKKSWHCTGKILNTPWFSCPEYKSPWTWTKWGNCAMFWQTHSREQANIKNCFDLICWYLLLLQLYLDTSSHEDCQLFDNMRLSEFGREEICES